jgi:hypothetical protein
MSILDSLKRLVGGQASSAIGGLSGGDLASVVTGLLGQGGTQLPALLEKSKPPGSATSRSPG